MYLLNQQQRVQSQNRLETFRSRREKKKEYKIIKVKRQKKTMQGLRTVGSKLRVWTEGHYNHSYSVKRKKKTQSA